MEDRRRSSRGKQTASPSLMWRPKASSPSASSNSASSASSASVKITEKAVTPLPTAAPALSPSHPAAALQPPPHSTPAVHSASHSSSKSSVQEGHSASSGSVKRKKRNKRKHDETLLSSSPDVTLPKSVTDTSSMVVEDLKAQLIHYLHNSETSVEQRTVVIDFDDLLRTNKQLAFSVCNSDNIWTEQWIKPAAQIYFEENGLSVDSPRIYFMNMPDRISDAKDVLNSRDRVRKMSLFGTKEEVLTSTLHGRTCFAVIQSELLSRISKNESWLGSLSIDDFVMAEKSGNLRAVITKPAQKLDAYHVDAASDLNGFWPMMEPFYLTTATADDVAQGGLPLNFEGLKETTATADAVAQGDLPLYFEELKEDLTTASADDVAQAWFIDYFTFHPALVSSMTRRNFVSEAYHVARKYKDAFAQLLEEEPFIYDWRDTARRHYVFRHIYNFKARQLLDKENKGKGEAEKLAEDGKADEALTTTQEEASSLQGAVKGECYEVTSKLKYGDGDSTDMGTAAEGVGAGTSNTEPEKVEDNREMGNKYSNTTYGLLKLNRHTLQHADERIRVKYLDEIEYLVAKHFGRFLPSFMKRLLKAGKMVKKCRLAAVWSVYKASKGAKDVL